MVLVVITQNTYKGVRDMDKPKILVKHSRIEISNYEMGDSAQLEYFFSVYDPVYHASFIKGMQYDEETQTLYLPRGIDVSYVESIFCCTAVYDNVCDEYVDVPPMKIKYLTRNDTQKQALRFTLGLYEYEYTKYKSQLSVNLVTGKGKTFITIATICASGSRAVIITSSIEWLNQWKAKIMEYTALGENDIYMLCGSPSVDKILCRNPLDYTIFLASHDTLQSYGENHGWSSIDTLFKYLRCGIKIYDEAHLYFDNICKIDFHSNTRKTLYLTATPQRSNKDENEIYQLYFKNIPSISLFNREVDAHAHYVAMFFNSHPQPTDIQTCKNAYGFDRNKYTTYIVDRPNYRFLLDILIDMTLYTNGKVLIFIGTNAAINKTYEMMIEDFPFLNGNIGIYTSTVKENKVAQLYNKYILTTTKSAGTASDIADLAVAINLAEPFSSNVLAQQALGRLRANDTLFIDAVDTGFYATKNYYQSKKPVYSKYAKTCKEVILSDHELEQRQYDIMTKYGNTKMMFNRVYKQ